MKREIRVLPKRTWDVVDVACDWNGWIVAGERTLVEADWVLPTGVTSMAENTTSGVAYLRVAGGTEGVDYGLLARATFSDGQRIEVVVILPILPNDSALSF